MFTLKTLLSQEYILLPECYDALIERPLDEITEIQMGLLYTRLKLEGGSCCADHILDTLQQAALVEFMSGRSNCSPLIEFCLKRGCVEQAG